MTTALRHSWYLSLRQLRNLARQPWFIAISLAQPLVYLLLYTALFERVVEIPGFEAGSYLDFLAPGLVVMTAMFSGGWSGIGVINDLERGVIDRFLVSPVTRGALIAGRLMQQAIVTVIQSLVLVGLALAIGADFEGGVVGVAVLIATAIMLGTAFGALSIGLALAVRREESVVAAVQLLLLPLTFLSSVFIQRDLIPGWIRHAARFNPADWAVQAGREAVGADVDWSSVLLDGGYLAAFALACAWLGARGFRAYQRSA
jgi:ABC-2 type transport system permease protein